MTPQDVRSYFKSTYRFNLETGKSSASMGYWILVGHVPMPAQQFLEEFTNGELVARISDLPKPKKRE